MSKKKRIALILGIILLIFLAIGIFIGNYFVDFALRRGNAVDAKAIPAGCAQIIDPKVKPKKMPNFPQTNWDIVSHDGLVLKASRFMAVTPTNNWVVVVHGYGRTQNSVFDIADYYLQQGFNVLTPDLRAAGTSEGQYLSMGHFESEDLLLWIQKIVDEDKNARIALHGVSMGGATVMLTSAKKPISNVKVLIEDCGFTSAYEMFAKELKRMYGLPAFPIMNFVDIVCKYKTGHFLSEAAPVDVIEHTKIPTLFIHGEEDKLAPKEMAEELYKVSTAAKYLVMIPKAEHADARIQDQDKYYGEINKFLQQHMLK